MKIRNSSKFVLDSEECQKLHMFIWSFSEVYEFLLFQNEGKRSREVFLMPVLFVPPGETADLSAHRLAAHRSIYPCKY